MASLRSITGKTFFSPINFFLIVTLLEFIVNLMLSKKINHVYIYSSLTQNSANFKVSDRSSVFSNLNSCKNFAFTINKKKKMKKFSLAI